MRFVCPIIYEDKYIIVVNKLPGFVVQGVNSDYSLYKALKEYIKKRDNKPGDVFIGVVHRLDKLVSGALLFAKRSKVARILFENIREGKFVKIYLGITEGVPEKEGLLVYKIVWNHKIKKAIVKEPLEEEGKICVTYLKIIKKKKGKSIVLLSPITGRKHQLRAVLSYLKAPIWGDYKYGGKRYSKNSAILLHSLCLSFPHPKKKEEMHFFAEVPKYFPKFYLDKKVFWDFFNMIKKFQELKMSEELILCSNCAWREVCTKRFQFDNTKPIKCPDYSPDYNILKQKQKEDKKESGFDKEEN